MDKSTYSVEEAAQILGIGRNSAYEAIRQGKIPSLRIGSRILVPKHALEQSLGLVVEPVPEQTHPQAIPVQDTGQILAIKHTQSGKGDNAVSVRVAYTLPETATLRDVLKLMDLGNFDWIEIPVQG